MSTCEIPLTSLKGVGDKLAEKLYKLGIRSLLDLLFHLPRTYQDRTRLIPFNQLYFGRQALVEGEVVHTEIKQGRRRMMLVHVSDNHALLVLRFFHFSMAQFRQIQVGSVIRAFGEVKMNKFQKEMIHPEYKLYVAGSVPPVDPVLTPVYPLTDGLTQPRLRSLVEQAFSRVTEDQVEELLPEQVRAQYKLPRLVDALKFVHYPPKDCEVTQLLAGEHPMQERLALEELIAHRISMLRVRSSKTKVGSPMLKPTRELTEKLKTNLPFELTGAQKRVIQEIESDMSSSHSMLRLLQGDVGSGKTMVALMGALQAVENHKQVAIMAPTEILAEQHYLNMQQLAEPLGVNVAWLVGKLTAKQKREALEVIQNGEAQIVVGTQALFQDSVEFADLGLVIVDEQHRFGVEQRQALHFKGKKNGLVPHQLVMTATPIPRTLAMTAYADLDVSVIDELPPGRTPVKTVLVGDARRDEVVERVRVAVSEGKQAYWVCTLIEESEVLTCEAAEATYEKLVAAMHPFKVGLVHGRMKAKEKQAVMAEFKEGHLDLLVATTVIEVGVDVPNSSLMVIENPERLGLAQLHQLRGRVGRGANASFCVLLYHPPLSQVSQDRLSVMRETTDGFIISEKDLELRGPGEVLGTRQTGDIQFKIAELLRDKKLLPVVSEITACIFDRDDLLCNKLIERWIGDRFHYLNV